MNNLIYLDDVMDTIEQVFNFVNNRQFVTSESIADATELDLAQVIKALVILSGDKLVNSRFVSLDIVYDGKSMEWPAVYSTPAAAESEPRNMHPSIGWCPVPFKVSCTAL